MTTKQVAWSATHDWFVRDNGDGAVTVRETYTVRAPDGSIASGETLRTFDSASALRDWAGY